MFVILYDIHVIIQYWTFKMIIYHNLLKKFYNVLFLNYHSNNLLLLI